ncbi:hypothetical protein [uncultured Nitratireductor sp.]|uniref:DUF7507 domain-containing protein n=1 Tax=uncultured Nitratireductor sp. TaxID=520953 RepID=UPI0025CB9456|nr:hypothetical protein [uncultured Nitratireductor sp.]
MRTGVFALLLIPAAMMGDGVRAQSLPDFGTCDARIWLTQGSSTRLNLVDTSTNPFTFVDQGNVSYQYNGSAFNPLDNYGYGVRQGGAPRLSRIGSDGQTEDLGAISGVPSGLSVSSGDIADDGSYYVFGGTHPNRLYKIDIGTVSATSTTLSRPLVISDLAWSNGLLYSKENNSSRLISIDPATGSVTNVGDSGVSGVFGSMFGSPDAVYGSGNGGEGFYKFNTTTGRATRISSAPGASTNDGMKCATSRLPFAADIAISKTDEQEAYTAGEDVVYDIVVTNNGIFGATHITVSDPLPAGITAASWTCTGAGGGQCGNASGTGAISGELVDLPVDGTVTYQLTMTVPSDFTGDLINEASVIVPDDVQDDDLSNNTATDTDLQASLSFVKEGTLDDVNGNGLPDAGEPIVYTFTVTNTGDAPLTNVTIDDPDADVSGSIASLAPGASDSSSITGEHILTTEEIQTGSFENNASASAQDPDGDSVEADSSPPGGNPGDPSVVELLTEGDVGLEKASSLNDANGNGRPDAGETIDYVFTVTNTGNVTLTDVAVTDDRATVSGSPIASLDPGVSDSTSVTGVYEVTQADVDAGSVENVAEATGKDPEGNDVTALSSPPGGNPGDPTVTEMPQEGESDFVKEVSHEDANGNGLVDAGERLNYVFTVENTGNVTLSDVTVSDDRATVVGGPIASLAPGESDATTITGYYDVTQADIDSGSVDNVATATGKDPGGNDVTQVSRPPDGNPGDTTDLPIEADGTMSTVKESFLNDANGNGRPDAGETIDYVFTVTNTGNVTLTDVAVTDDRATVSGSPIASLAPGVSDSTSVTGVSEITQADIDAGSFENVAEATGTDPSGEAVSALSRPVDGDPGDPTAIAFEANPVIELELVDTWVDADGDGYPHPGEAVVYAFKLRNSGNVTVENIAIASLEVEADVGAASASGLRPRASVPVSGGTLASLSPGDEDETTFTASYPLSQADIDAGAIVATAVKEGVATDGTAVSDGSDDPHDGEDVDVEGDGEPDDPTATLLPHDVSLALEKAGSFQGEAGRFAEPGDTILYTFTVTNDGNVSVTDVTPADEGPRFDGRAGGGTLSSFSPSRADLEAGESATFTATYTVTQGDIDAAQGMENGIENTATASGTGPRGQEAVSPEAEATVEFPGYSITKTTPLAEVRRGGKVPYTIRVKAMGLSSTSTMNIVDMTPPGLSFVPGSALLDGAAVVPVVEGRKLTFEDVELVPDEPVSIDLDLAVTAAAKPGEYVNRAWVEDLSGTTVSRIATAVVEVVVEAVFDCGDIIGKVFDDKNRNGYQDGGEPGLAGVRIATVKGLLLTADDHGRFHVACADLPDQRIGTNYIMKLDPRSLPSGYRLTTENPRVVRLTAGKASEFLFGASIGRVVRLDLGDAAFVEGASALRPEWEARIVQMMALLEKEPSVLRLVYASAGEGKRLAQQRLKVLRKKLARDWRKAGSRYRLEIETRIISAQNHNIRPQKNVVYK